MGSTRRTILAAGAAAAATAAVPPVFAQEPGKGKGGTGKFYEKGSVRIYYEEAGSGFPLMLLPGGGLNSTIAFFTGNSPFNAIEEFKGQYRCITADLLAQPVGWRPEMRDPKYPGTFWKSWSKDLTAKRPEIAMQTADQFVTRMFETNPDFVFTVTRDFVRSCQNPVLVLPDEVPAHPYAVAMECAMLAPKAEVSMFPWKEPKERVPLAVRQIHSFLRAHQRA
jgi:hypothetical protein